MKLYVFGEPGVDLVKIGRSANPAARAGNLRGLRAGPKAAVLYAHEPVHMSAGDLEILTHTALRVFHKRGEWFAISAEAAIKAIQQQDRKGVSVPAHWRMSAAMKAAWQRRKEKYGPSGRRNNAEEARAERLKDHSEVMRSVWAARKERYGNSGRRPRHEIAVERHVARGSLAALVAAYEAGELTAQQWAELCTRIPGLEAAYQRKGTHTNN